MKHHVLTQMKAMKAPEGRYCDGEGLWLVKTSPHSGNWSLRIFVNGRRREMGLGRWPEVSISEARDKARDAKRLVRDARDPILARKSENGGRDRLTLKEAVEGCFQARQAQLKGEGTAGRWMSPLETHIIPVIGSVPVVEVDQHTIKRVLAPLWHEKAETAEKALSRLNLTLKHAAALGLNVDLQACMKARALLGKQRRVEVHIPSLHYSEAPEFYAWLCGVKGTPARALQFLMLTVARTSEVRFATREQISDGLWTIPAQYTKTGKEHRVPLVQEALSLASGDGILFPSPSGKPLSDMAMSMLMRREGFEARPHGFRATFRSWAEECTDASFEVKESCLGHAVDVGIVGAYQRSDRLEKRRELLSEWASFLTARP